MTHTRCEICNALIRYGQAVINHDDKIVCSLACPDTPLPLAAGAQLNRWAENFDTQRRILTDAKGQTIAAESDAHLRARLLTIAERIDAQVVG